jgi:hypothetical protein
MLCKIWGYRGGASEECHLQGHKNSVHTSQQTYYFSATEPSWLTLCKIWGFHGDDYEDCRLLGCYVVGLLWEPYVLEELSISIIRVTRICELETTLAAFFCSVNRLLVDANAVPSSPILVTLMMEALQISETRFLQGPHGVTSQKTAFLKNFLHLPGI